MNNPKSQIINIVVPTPLLSFLGSEPQDASVEMPTPEDLVGMLTGMVVTRESKLPDGYFLRFVAHIQWVSEALL